MCLFIQLLRYLIAGFFHGENFRKFPISMVICESFVRKNQPGIGSRHHDLLDVPRNSCQLPPRVNRLYR